MWQKVEGRKGDNDVGYLSELATMRCSSLQCSNASGHRWRGLEIVPLSNYGAGRFAGLLGGAEGWHVRGGATVPLCHCPLGERSFNGDIGAQGSGLRAQGAGYPSKAHRPDAQASQALLGSRASFLSQGWQFEVRPFQLPALVSCKSPSAVVARSTRAGTSELRKSTHLHSTHTFVATHARTQQARSLVLLKFSHANFHTQQQSRLHQQNTERNWL